MELKKKLKWLDPFTYVDLLLEKINPSHNPLIDWPAYLVSAIVFAWIAYLFFGFLFATKTPFVIVLSESMEPVLYRGDVILLTGAAANSLNVQTVNANFSLAGKAFADFADPVYVVNEKGIILDTNVIVFKNGETVELNKNGDIVIYDSDYLGIPIIHRAVLKIVATDGTFLLTKGDNVKNTRIDQDCGKLEQRYVLNSKGETVSVLVPTKECIALYPIKVNDISGKAVFKIPLIGYVKLLLFDDLPILLFGCPTGRTCTFP
jgi:signal peptidase I